MLNEREGSKTRNERRNERILDLQLEHAADCEDAKGRRK